MAEAAITPQDNIIEVGTGLAVLTEELAKNAGHITTIEYDAALIPILQNELKKYTNVELIQSDALTYSLPTKPYKLVANIPYYITSPLLNHFLRPVTKEQKRPSLIVLLVQKEVAEKICAKAGDHSILSLQVQIFGKPAIKGIVHRSSFFPQPKVDSAILKIELEKKPIIEDLETFFKLAKAAFSQKRKTIGNSLKNSLHLTSTVVASLLEKADIKPERRPQTLSLQEWQKLTTIYKTAFSDSSI